ncbi:N-acetylglucosamine-6-phosphate deacetylase [Brevibacterium aurantiacum]|uniref:N-acetylglucosamine-6-phosphate deacetylase n=2 Tax=Brevibacterium aurantiacum TaxID=273384 RepID=A0A2A3ZS68_BREAU|nr:N-acetylglucosamine-6-phosphate deacetylase [Brevibacterium aurantiacum]AZT95024.1 N-acetylglucosamine-6-phosphate deacetylase [Brevibacterium aurantiacum]PCC54388.1 N-acetylglucosamine-6-phosphate deacetylase [Brevibacterium aurantiacum]
MSSTSTPNVPALWGDGSTAAMTLENTLVSNMMPADTITHNAVILDGDPTGVASDGSISDGPTPATGDDWIASAGGTVIARGRGMGWKDLNTSATVQIIDAEGAYLAPAYVDMHCHGAGGSSAEDGEPGLAEVLAVHRRNGTRALALSYVSDTVPGLCRSLAAGARLCRDNPAVLGLHAEGPFLSPDFKGAHAPEVLTAPTPEAVESILAAADGALAQITIAPELPGAIDAISRFASAGVSVAIGHTAAGYEEAARAFEAGARILTHTFNAMPGIHHRAPGPILAAVDAGHVSLELINDGVHVAGPPARMLAKLAPGRIALITDAMAATGMADGAYMLGSLPVQVEDSVARLLGEDGSTGSIAGSTLTMDDAVMRAVAEVGMSPLAAVQAASLVPLRALGLIAADEHCLLRAGMPAEYLLLNADMSIRAQNMAR